MSAIWSFLLKTLIQEVVAAITKMVADHAKLRSAKKKNKVIVKAALNEKDPKIRAKRIRTLLS